MAAKYSVVQYIPDPIADERINVGVLVFDQQVVRARFLSNWERVRQFANQDIRFLQEFGRSVSEAASQPTLLPFLASNYTLNQELITTMVGSWINSIQLTEPRGSLKNVDDLLPDVVTRFLSEPTRTRRGFRDRRAAAGIAARQIRAALTERVGEEAEDLLKKEYTLEGAMQGHTFDAVVANGAPYFAAHGVSFELPEARRLRTYVDALAWAITDVRAVDRTLPLAIVALPPKEDVEEHGRLVDLYHHTVKVYTGLGAEVLTERDIERWANRMASLIPIHGQ